MKDDIICWFSGGVTSAVAIHLCIQLFGLDRCRIIFIDTKNEDEDTYRFLQDCEKWYGKEIEWLSNEEYQNIKEFVKFIDDPDNRKYRQALAISLNYFESISAMVLAGDLDNEIVKRLFCKLFGRYYIRLKHYIAYRQEEAPKSWVSFETLAKKWLNDEKL